MKRILLIFILLIPLFNWGQINPNPYSINWDGAPDIKPWENIINTFNVTNIGACQGSHSIRARVFGSGIQKTAVIMSPNLGPTLGGVITFSYDYKWVIYNAGPGAQTAASRNQLDLKWQWSNSKKGPWYNFDSKNATNHVESIDCVPVLTNFAPYAASSLYVRLVVSNYNAGGADNFIYIDNINISEGNPATCVMPKDIFITDKATQSFTLNWDSNSTQSILDYDWEVRTSGEPGSGPAGRVQFGTTGTKSAPVTGLTAGTLYKVYVRANCNATNSSFWIGMDVNTLCNADFNTKNEVDICGVQPAKLEVTGTVGGSTTFWFDDKFDLLLQGANTYTTPDIAKSEKYFVTSGLFKALRGTAKIETGSSTGAVNSVPFTASKANKVQYIYLASELHAAGFSEGMIKGFGIKVGAVGGTLQRNNVAIHMGETLLEEFYESKFIPSDRLKLVKKAGDHLLKADQVNMFAFDADTPFIWDGVSNIVVQISYSDLSVSPTGTQSMYASLLSSGNNRSLFAGSAVNNLNQMINLSPATVSEYRVNGFFDVLEGCFGKIETINVNFKEAPKFALSDSIINNCSGQPLSKIYVLSGANDYDVYEWGPNDLANPGDPNNASNAIVGDKNIGWTFNPATPTTYYLTVKNSGGEKCINYSEVKVDISPTPTMLQLLNNYNLCTSNIEELKVDYFVNDTPHKYLFNGNLNGVTMNNSVSGDAITNNNVFFSEGTGSLKIAYAAKTNASVDFTPAVDMRNLKSIVIEFDHIAAMQAINNAVMDYAYIEYTTDGVTWKPFLPTDYIGGASKTLPIPVNQTGFLGMFFTKTSYPDWVTISETGGVTNAMWKSEKFVVPASDFNGTGTFKMRFKVGSDGNTQYDGWYVDNVRITPISNYQVSWSPIANLYYDQNATKPYDGLINSGTLYLKGNSSLKNAPYKVTLTNQFGCSVEKTFNVNIGLDETPVVRNLSNCGPINVADTGFGKNTNGILTYYNSLTGSSTISQITTSGVYYVQQEIAGCISQRVPFTVVINTKPTDPVAPIVQDFCGSATVNDLKFNSIIGFQIKWYLTASGGTALVNSTPLINGGSYYAEFNNGVCVSDNRFKVNVTVGTTPAAISLNDVYICGISTINDIKVSSASGAVVKWYQNINDTNALSGTTVLANGIYYVAQKIGACESTRTPVNVTTIQNLVAPTANTQTFCGTATVGDLVASGISTGATINWYSFNAADTPLSNSTALTSGTYYVAQSIGNCESGKRAVAVKIISVNAPVINPISICGDATIGTLPLNASTGTAYKVYATAWATTEMNQSDVVTSGTYYISKVESGCETGRAAVYITVTPRLNAPTGNTKQSFDDYAEVKDLKMNESNVKWFNSSNDALNNTNQLPSYTALQNNKTYYAVVEGPNGCTSLPTAVTVTIVLGLNDLDLASLKYYPNPADSELTVSYKEPIRSIEIYDILGKQIKVQKFETNEVRLDVSRLSSGTYMLKVQTDSGSQVVKVVKK